QDQVFEHDVDDQIGFKSGFVEAHAQQFGENARGRKADSIGEIGELFEAGAGEIGAICREVEQAVKVEFCLPKIVRICAIFQWVAYGVDRTIKEGTQLYFGEGE